MNSILLDFFFFWQPFYADLIITHFDDSFVYDSQWVFSSLDRDQYIDYIIGKFQTLRSKNIYIEVSIVDDPYLGNSMLRLIQNGETCFYRIKVHDNKVIKGDLCMF